MIGIQNGASEVEEESDIVANSFSKCSTFRYQKQRKDVHLDRGRWL